MDMQLLTHCIDSITFRKKLKASLDKASEPLVSPVEKSIEATTPEKTEDAIAQAQIELDLMWDKIQELKETDTFAAQVMYEKYRQKSGEIPPPIPSKPDDQVAI